MSLLYLHTVLFPLICWFHSTGMQGTEFIHNQRDPQKNSFCKSLSSCKVSRTNEVRCRLWKAASGRVSESRQRVAGFRKACLCSLCAAFGPANWHRNLHAFFMNGVAWQALSLSLSPPPPLSFTVIQRAHTHTHTHAQTNRILHTPPHILSLSTKLSPETLKSHQSHQFSP